MLSYAAAVAMLANMAKEYGEELNSVGTCECGEAPEGVNHPCGSMPRMDTPDMHPTTEDAFGGKAGA